MFLKLAGVLVLSLVTFIPQQKKVTIWMAGDSTMSIKDVKAYPETGWGMPFIYFFDSTVTVQNKAKNGRSTKTCISEGIWKSITGNISEGDYVFIQFGHNDEVKEKVNTYTTPEEFRANLKRFIAEARDKKGIPVLLTPVSRRKFESGVAMETHAQYSPLVREVAKETKVAFVDMDTKSRELYQQMGEEQSKLLFLQLAAGEHPNYPAGKIDNTHFSELGARKIAQIALAEIRTLLPDLAARIIKR